MRRWPGRAWKATIAWRGRRPDAPEVSRPAPPRSRPTWRPPRRRPVPRGRRGPADPRPRRGPRAVPGRAVLRRRHPRAPAAARPHDLRGRAGGPRRRAGGRGGRGPCRDRRPEPGHPVPRPRRAGDHDRAPARRLPRARGRDAPAVVRPAGPAVGRGVDGLEQDPHGRRSRALLGLLGPPGGRAGQGRLRQGPVEARASSSPVRPSSSATFSRQRFISADRRTSASICRRASRSWSMAWSMRSTASPVARRGPASAPPPPGRRR